MDSVIGFAVVAAISFPVSFFVARSCLRGVIRIITGSDRRHVL